MKNSEELSKGRVLVVAGSDSGGGAGIQGDIKTITMLGGYAATAITAVTAQNTLGVFGIHEIPDDFIAQQMRLVLDDIGADVIKTGMLHKASVIHTVADVLRDYANIPLVLDPVMSAKGGAALLQTEAVQALVKRLIPLAAIITPNIPEAEILLGGRKIENINDMEAAGSALLTLGSPAVMMKGGHAHDETVTDLLIMRRNGIPFSVAFTAPRMDTKHTHGTGCTLASAIATGLAQGMELADAVKRAHAYVQQAIRTAPGLGKGNGPLNHHHVF